MTLVVHTPDRIAANKERAHEATRPRFSRRDCWGMTGAVGAIAVKSLPALTKRRSRSWLESWSKTGSKTAADLKFHDHIDA